MVLDMGRSSPSWLVMLEFLMMTAVDILVRDVE